jgi:short-subunit dehydrogenase
MKLAGKTAIVTGAASGIGQALASALGRRNCHLALADMNQAGMAETASQISSAGIRVSCHQLDVADRQAVAAFPETVMASHSGVDILVNNAGVALGGSFEQTDEADFEWLFDINFWGVVRMTRAFLPLLKASGEGQLVNLSSLFGLIAPPGQAAYSASKFAVRGFSESLRHELKGTGVGVTTVHPGGIATAIAGNARMSKEIPAAEQVQTRLRFQHFLKMPAERAGEIIAQGIEHRRPRIIIGSDAKLMASVERLFPVSYWRMFS